MTSLGQLAELAEGYKQEQIQVVAVCKKLEELGQEQRKSVVGLGCGWDYSCGWSVSWRGHVRRRSHLNLGWLKLVLEMLFNICWLRRICGNRSILRRRHRGWGLRDSDWVYGCPLSHLAWSLMHRLRSWNKRCLEPMLVYFRVGVLLFHSL